MDIYGLNTGFLSDPADGADGLSALASRLNAGGESYQAALVTYANLNWDKQFEVKSKCRNEVQDQIDIDTYLL